MDIVKKKKKTNLKNSFYGLGKRKTSIAKVILKEGDGKIIINDKPMEVFFQNIGDEREMLKKPILLLNIQGKIDIFATVKGGGTNSQLEAIRLGISRALGVRNANDKKLLNKNYLLRRDSRIKERRKYGLKKARKAPQYSKR